MSKILWINPIGTDIFDNMIKEGLQRIKRKDTQVEVVSLSSGPKHLEYRYYEAMVIPELLRILRQAEKDGYDGAVIGCFYDLGLYDAREILESMAVTAPAEACGHLAATLGHSFSVIATEDLCIPQMSDTFAAYGLKDKVASFKSLGMGVHQLHKDEKLTLLKIKEKAREAVEKDRAEVVVLGCTIQFGFYEEIQNCINVPVIDAIIAPFKYIEFLAEVKNKFGWMHSKKYGFQSPPVREMLEWGLE